MSECTAVLLPTYVAPVYQRWQDCWICCFSDLACPNDDEDEYGCSLCDEGEAIEWAIDEYARLNGIERACEDDL